MVKKISLHIGINELDPGHYFGSGFSRLKACVNDAKLMASIAIKQGFDDIVPCSTIPNKILSDEDANYSNVKSFIENCASELEEGGIFFLTYSGHGSRIQFPTTTEPDLQDETWCLYDKELFDDEILEMLSLFKKDCRIIFISDSCHSGTIITERFLDPYRNELMAEGFDFANFERKILFDLGADFLEYDEEVWERDIKMLRIGPERLSMFKAKLQKDLYYGAKEKTLLTEIQDAVYLRFKEDYDSRINKTRDRLQRRLGTDTNFRKLVKPSVIQISACQDNEKTRDGSEITLGKFTTALDLVWNDGHYSQDKNYYNFYADIVRKFTAQTPGWDLVGNNDNNNAKFRAQHPFSL